MRSMVQSNPLIGFALYVMIVISKAKAMSMSTSSAVKTALITGSTDGIGVTTAKNLAKKGRNADRIKKLSKK